MNEHIIEFHARLVAFYERIKNTHAAKYHLRLAWLERKKASLKPKTKLLTCLHCGSELPDIVLTYSYYYENGFVGLRVCNKCTKHIINMHDTVAEDE